MKFVHVSTLLSNPNYQWVPQYTLNASLSVCFDPSEEVVMSGLLGMPLSKAFLIIPSVCSNSTSNNYTCHSPDVIAAKMVRPFMFLTFQDVFINNANKTDVVQHYGRTEELINSSGFLKTFQIPIYNTNYNSDNGIVFTDIVTQEFYTTGDVQLQWFSR